LVINHIYWLGRSFLHLFGIEVWKPERYLRLRCLKVPFRLPDRHRLVWSHTERREGQNNPSTVSLRHQICNLPIGSHVFPFRWRRGHRCFCSPDICHVRGSGDHTQIFPIHVFQHLGEIFYSIDLNHAVILLTINPIFKVAKCAFWYYSSHALLFHGFTTLITNLTGNNHTNFGGHIK
jgi:hypothetical protein